MTEESLRKRIFSSYSGPDSPPLNDLAAELLRAQNASWPGLAEAYRALDAVEIREVACAGFAVKLQYNPRRITSSGARTDPESVKKRRCFLCIGHLPEEQKGIIYRGSFLVLINPAPILTPHYTIACIHHEPQSIERSLDIFLSLARDFGPDMDVFYNGPQCGASAPDHLHFQVVPSGALPVEKETPPYGRRSLLLRRDGVEISRAAGLGREIVVFEGNNPDSMAHTLRKFISVMECRGSLREPMLNMISTYSASGWRVLLFPRGKHRPSSFYSEGEENILVSPAALDMAGLIITPRRKDFETMNAGNIQSMFREVSVEEKSIANWWNLFKKNMGGRRKTKSG
ncbi:MAG: DUF4922 domain-containing protein [Syntrophales bacterium]